MNYTENKTKRLIVFLTAILLISFTLKGQVKSPIENGKEKVALLSKQSEMKASSPFKDLKWQYIGPTNISGRCTDVEAVIPHGGNYTIWVGSATGGVWKSTNEGTTFEPVFGSMPTASIGDIAIDPNNRMLYGLEQAKQIFSEAQMPDAGFLKQPTEEKHGI